MIRKLGKPVFMTALALLLSIGTIGFLVGSAFQFTPTESLLIGLSMFFSSTIIIAKVLSDKKEISRLNGQIAIGVILLDDTWQHLHCCLLRQVVPVIRSMHSKSDS